MTLRLLGGLRRGNADGAEGKGQAERRGHHRLAHDFISVSVNPDASRIGARASNSLTESDTGQRRGGSGAESTMKRTARWWLRMAAARHEMRTLAPSNHQMRGTISVALTIGSPGLHPNAVANSALFDSGPFTRHCSGE